MKIREEILRLNKQRGWFVLSEDVEHIVTLFKDFMNLVVEEDKPLGGDETHSYRKGYNKAKQEIRDRIEEETN